MPSVLVSDSGTAALPSFSLAQGQISPGFSPNHLVVATGTTPRASRASCSVSPTTTTRWGTLVISVVPYLCSMLTGNAALPAELDAAEAAGALSSPQAATRASAAVATAPPKARRLRLNRSGVGRAIEDPPS